MLKMVKVVKYGFGVIREALLHLHISTSVCVDVIKLQSWNSLSAPSVYLASIILYL